MGKTCRLNVRVDPEQKQYVVRQSEKSGIDESTCIRKLIDSSMKHEKAEFKDQKEFQMFRELISEINKIGTNINQITKNHNSHFYNDYEKKKLFAMMKRIEEKVMEISEL